jgi:hypothetical protein
MMRKKATMTAMMPNVAERMRPKWWKVRPCHSGVSLTVGWV